MDLSPGARLGPYEIVSRLGAGGMGEVYRARDTRLDRAVAIKVLPAALSGDAQLKLRFDREAKAISQLNHPNICTLHDVGDGYIVMELLEGETLAARIARGPIPLGDVIRYGAQIADALHRAHRAGIVHRDLKPANVMITKSGAKLLDFGLAKPSGMAFGSEETTIHGQAALTEKGMILGTVQYMAPEQLEGIDTDARTDIFALGALLYEMTTGKRAFDGSSRTSIIAAIVSAQPPAISSIVPVVPPALEHIVQKCLEKDPDDRWQSAHDVGEQLRWMATPSGSMVAPAVAAPQSRKRFTATLLVMTALVAAAAGVALDRFVLRRAPKVPLLHYASFSGLDAQPAVSPDGKSIAFTSKRDGRQRIWIRQLNGGGEIAITDGPDIWPRFSPDGTSVLFSRGDPASAIYRVSAFGGEARKIVDDAYDGEWSPDGKTLAFLRATNTKGGWAFNLFIADANGANAHSVYSSLRWGLLGPRFSPDGRTLAVSCSTGQTNTSGALALIDLASGKSRVLDVTGSPTSIVWLDNDKIVYGHIHRVTGVQNAPGEILRQSISGGKPEILASLPALGTSIDRAGPHGLVVDTPSLHANLRAQPLVKGQEPSWLTRGNTTDRQPAFSPDGEWILFSSDRSANLDLWATSRKTGMVRRLTDDPGQDWDPQFTPDGKSILWSSNRTGHFEIWKADADGSAPRQISRDGFDAENPTQSINGDVFYVSADPKKNGLWCIRRDGSTQHLVKGTTLHPEVSPDGAYVTYHSSLNGEDMIYVIRVSDGKVMNFATHFGNSGFVVVGRSRWMSSGKALAFIGYDDARIGVYTQPFDFDHDTQALRKPLAGFDPTQPAESFGIAPDDSLVVMSLIDDLNTITLIDDIDLER